jgi:gas vesicle protein
LVAFRRNTSYAGIKILSFNDDDHRHALSENRILTCKLKNKIMTTTKAALGVLAGLAAGVALGVLFAPDKGSETRKSIVKKGSDVAEDVEDIAELLEEKMNKKFDDLVNAINTKVKKFKTQAEEINRTTVG